MFPIGVISCIQPSSVLGLSFAFLQFDLTPKPIQELGILLRINRCGGVTKDIGFMVLCWTNVQETNLVGLDGWDVVQCGQRTS
ncbi:hypothetical protein WICPIJ_008895 [Wickerhamomyces pijperi]|uniref:Uncharacterized protein n=1 Tax=Wickerhamomyces pijperi TaxID=599730 RepID=A0A9P8TGX5_WICPI|nr:hypothetical protein WICPIJ_008895 [Wickerhamomyces pijperi]